MRRGLEVAHRLGTLEIRSWRTRDPQMESHLAINFLDSSFMRNLSLFHKKPAICKGISDFEEQLGHRRRGGGSQGWYKKERGWLVYSMYKPCKINHCV